MPKYLIQANYSAEGMAGLIKDTASGRQAAVKEGLKSLGGKLESMYYALGGDDAVIIVEMPDNASAAGLSAAVAATGMVKLRTTPLLTIGEMDKAVAKKNKYRAPGTPK